MDSRIIVRQKDDSVWIIIPAPEMFDSKSLTRSLLECNGITFNNDKEVLEWIINKDVPKDLSYMIVHKTELPSRDEYRDAWRFDGEKIYHDVDKVNEINKKMI